MSEAQASAELQALATYALLDTSRVSTFVIAILLIVYGSFRSLNMETDVKGNTTTSSGTQQLDSTQALLLPLGASVSLLIMFFFFDSLQTVFAFATALIATIAFAFLLLPMCQYLTRPCSDNGASRRVSFGCIGRYSVAELLSLFLAFSIVALWVLTGHWLLMDALAMGLCVAFIALVRLPSLKVSTVLLSGLLLYDIFWVFFSSYIFNANVMVRVATRPADNPVGMVARKLQLSMLSQAPKLSLPGKLVFPNTHGHFTMLGLGDIVMPGLLLCFVLRYDAHKRQSNGATDSRITYFHCSLIGYFLGLLTATASAEVFKAAQPALLYLVPFTLLPLLIMAYLKGDLRRMWHEPFYAPTAPRFQIV